MNTIVIFVPLSYSEQTNNILSLAQVKAYMDNHKSLIRNLAQCRKMLELSYISKPQDHPKLTTENKELTTTLYNLEQIADNCFDLVFLYHDYIVQEGKNSSILAGYVSNRLKRLAGELHKIFDYIAHLTAVQASAPSDETISVATNSITTLLTTEITNYLQWINLLTIQIIKQVPCLNLE